MERQKKQYFRTFVLVSAFALRKQVLVLFVTLGACVGIAAEELDIAAIDFEAVSAEELEALYATLESEENIISNITVTAQKRAQNINEVPVSLSAYSNEFLAKNAVVEAQHLDSLAPSLIISHNQAPSTTNLSIRGIGTSATNFGLESSVGIYVDGVYRARQSSILNLLHDVEAIEILRGPQGTLFGKNTPSGAVLLRSRKPVFEGFGELTVGAGNFDSHELGVVVSDAITQDLAYRVSGVTLQRDGMFDDITFGNEALNTRDRSSMKLQLLWKPGKQWEVHATADVNKIDEICCTAVTFQDNVSTIFLSPPQPGSDAGIIGLGGQITTAGQFRDLTSTLSKLPQSTLDENGVSLEVNGTFSDTILTSVTAYRHYEVAEDYEADFTTLDVLTVDDAVGIYSFSQEFRLDTQIGDAFDVMTGLYYYDQRLNTRRDLIFGSDAASFFGLGGGLDGESLTTITSGEQRSLALFSQSEYRFDEELSIFLGLRYTHEEKKFVGEYRESAVLPPIPIALLSPRTDTDEELDVEELTGTAKLLWQPNDNLAAFISYANGFKSGGMNTQRIAASDEVVFLPETTDSYEIGIKAKIPSHDLFFNAAVFDARISDYQASTFAGDGFVLENAGSLETKGVELDLNWQPMDRLLLSVAYAYTDATFDEFENGTCQVAFDFHTLGPDPLGLRPTECDQSGDRVALVPEHTARTSVERSFVLAKTIDSSVSLHWNYQSDAVMDSNNDPLKTQDAYSTFDAEWILSFGEHTRLLFWGKNLTDRLHYGTVFDVPNQDGKLNTYPRENRTFGMRLTRTFQ